MRKSSNRQVRRKENPLESSSKRTVGEKISEQFLVKVFQQGLATKENLQYLMYMSNMMAIASNMLRDTKLLKLTERIYGLVKQIESRKQTINSMTLRASELELLKEVVHTYDVFWCNRSKGLYDACDKELKAFIKDRHAHG